MAEVTLQQLDLLRKWENSQGSPHRGVTCAIIDKVGISEKGGPRCAPLSIHKITDYYLRPGRRNELTERTTL